jgi:hypothetical protein
MLCQYLLFRSTIQILTEFPQVLVPIWEGGWWWDEDTHGMGSKVRLAAWHLSRTRTRENPHPQPRVWVLMGTGCGLVMCLRGRCLDPLSMFFLLYFRFNQWLLTTRLHVQNKCQILEMMDTPYAINTTERQQQQARDMSDASWVLLSFTFSLFYYCTYN